MLPDLLPFLPRELLGEIQSEAFRKRCEKDFAVLDENGTGVLEPRELYPVILNLSQARNWSLTEEHCRHFVEIFDIQGNGVITIEEYFSFAGFMLITAFMQTDEGAAVQLNMEMAQSAHEVEELLQMLEKDRSAVHKVIPMLPEDFYNQLIGNEFVMACHRRFLGLDQDKTNVLRPRELIPVVAELSDAFQHTITVSQCERFTNIFDIRGDGVLNLEEFLEFSRFLCIMVYLNTPEGKAACKDALQIMSDSAMVDQLLETLEHDPSKMHEAFAYLPENLKIELLSEHFTVDCMTHFQEVDKDGRGSLGPEEVYPVIVALSNSHEASLDLDQCRRFTAFFDTTGTGLITSNNFVDFARFLIVMAWLKSHEGQQVWNMAFKSERPPTREKVQPKAASRELDPSLLSSPSKKGIEVTSSQAAEPSPSDILAELQKERAAMKGSLDLEPATDDLGSLSSNLATLGIDTPSDYHQKSEKLSAENDTLRDRLSSLEDLIKSLEGR